MIGFDCMSALTLSRISASNMHGALYLEPVAQWVVFELQGLEDFLGGVHEELVVRVQAAFQRLPRRLAAHLSQRPDGGYAYLPVFVLEELD